MTELLFYRRPVVLNKDQHRDLKVGEIREYRFAARTNSVPLAAIEFFDAAREYPIVFAGKDTPLPVPAALLSLRINENLFITPKGSWDGRYIPAFVRRYPFVLAGGDDQLMVCIDEGHPSVRAYKGQPLFTASGDPAPMLQNAMTFLREYQMEAQRTRAFVQRIVELGLLTEVAARAELKGGSALQLGGFSVIDEAKYRALEKDTVDEFFRQGWLALIDAHLLSLGNLGRLMDRLPSPK